jgi:hypothetical protein
MRSGCLTSSARDNGHGGRWWTLRGRRRRRATPAEPTEPLAEQEETQSPLTDSNRRPPPYHFWSGISVHARSSPATFILQMRPSVRATDARACPRVLDLVYPSRTRGVLSLCKTDNGAMGPLAAMCRRLGAYECGLFRARGDDRALREVGARSQAVGEQESSLLLGRLALA